MSVAPHKASIKLPTRIVGIDWGAARLGMALSDARKVIATPLKTIKADKKSEETAKKVIDELKVLAEAGKYEIESIVVGMPYMMSGKTGLLADEVLNFIEKLKLITSIPIIMWDERLTTALAERSLKESSLSRKRRAQVVDAVAAVVILQNYLDHLVFKSDTPQMYL